jgi:hypothetical protein
VQLPTEDTLRSLNFENFFDVSENMKELLAWLWNVAVCPVLRHLQIYPCSKQSPPARPPRVHWVISGFMGLMPLHAAGYHDRDSTENTLSYVIFSYTSNLKSLVRILNSSHLKPSQQDGHHPVKAVVVGMLDTPAP